MKKFVYMKQGIVAIYLALWLGGWEKAACPSLYIDHWDESSFPILPIGDTDQVARLNINGETYQCGSLTSRMEPHWMTASHSDLSADVLAAHLRSIGANCFKELGRLILAQEIFLYDGNEVKHDVAENNNPDYINQGNRDDLSQTNVMKNLFVRMHDSGVFGPSVSAKAIQPFHSVHSDFSYFPSRRYFNFNRDIVESYQDNSGLGGSIFPSGHLTFGEAVKNLVTNLFSSNSFEKLSYSMPGYKDHNRFTFEATYTGPAIAGNNYVPIGPKRFDVSASLGLTWDSQGVVQTPTNRIGVLIAVEEGVIRLPSLYPEFPQGS